MSTISSDLAATYSSLLTPPSGAAASWYRDRGYKFEKLLVSLLSADDLDPRASFKVEGEQIDGSFFLDGTVFLLEAKWHSAEMPASTLYEFKGKVDGKLVGTLGVFISMSGYSSQAVDALTTGKSLNLILFDSSDMDAAITRGLGFRNVLKQKLRKAAEEGIVYFPVESKVVTRTTASTALTESAVGDSAPTLGFSSAPSLPHLQIVCEAPSDRELISALAQRILSAERLKRKVLVSAAMGKFSVPRVANSFRNNLKGRQLLLVVDGDSDVSRTASMLKAQVELPVWLSVIPDPSIQSWFEDKLPHRTEYASESEWFHRLHEIVSRVDLQALRASQPSFNNLYDTIVGARS